MKDSLNIAIAGATGYIGLELIKILSKHNKVKILYICATKSIGKNINHFDKSIKSKKLPKISKLKKVDWKKVNILFTALPNGEAQKIIKIIPKHVRLIDLSADFRLRNPNIYKKWYGIKHKSKKFINKSIYAITEFSKSKLNDYRIISCPGCYPTSVQIPLLPLIKEKVISIKNIIIDSKSGFSGAGKNFKKKFKYKNLFNSTFAYGVNGHRHIAELDQEFKKASNKKINIQFTPHVIPTFRGILSTIYIDSSKKNNALKIYKFLKKFHKKNFFIKFSKFNEPIATGDVINTNFCKISVCLDRNKRKIIIISAIDNLIKGGSGQAVQNMNVAYNFKETTGLL